MGDLPEVARPVLTRACRFASHGHPEISLCNLQRLAHPLTGVFSTSLGLWAAFRSITET